MVKGKKAGKKEIVKGKNKGARPKNVYTDALLEVTRILLKEFVHGKFFVLPSDAILEKLLGHRLIRKYNLRQNNEAVQDCKLR